MPSVQRGSVTKRGSSWAARYYDETGTRRFRGGFATKSEAREFVDEKVDVVEAIRRGDAKAMRRQMPTLSELVAEFIGQHSAEDSTIASLRQRLRYALEGTGLDGKGGWRNVALDRLQPHEIGTWRKRLPNGARMGSTKPSVRYSTTPSASSCSTRTRPHSCRIRSRSDGGPEVHRPRPRPRRALNSPALRAIPLFAGLTGLRPRSGSHSNDATSTARPASCTCRRVYADGTLKPYGKTSR